MIKINISVYSSAIIEPLPEEITRILEKPLIAAIKGFGKQWIVCYENNIAIVRKGAMANDLFASEITNIPYCNIIGTSIFFNRVFGCLEIQANGIPLEDRCFNYFGMTKHRKTKIIQKIIKRRKSII